MSCRECDGGGYSKNCENSLEHKTVRYIAVRYPYRNKKERDSRERFESDRKDGIPLNCNLPASKGTMQKFNEPVRIAPFRSSTNSRLSANRKIQLKCRILSRAYNGGAKIPSPYAASLSRRYPCRSPPRNDTSRTGASMSCGYGITMLPPSPSWGR